MGVVYRARQTNLNRVVALKMILGGQLAGPEDVRRFRQEAEAAAQLKHPNIVAIHEVGERDGQHYFSMDFIEGQTLRQLTRDNPLPAQRAAAYLKTIAEAVQYAHERGVVHRDLKPSNVLIDAADQPHVTDFGLAKRIDAEGELTMSGDAMGTPGYMPPEQAAGRSKTVGPLADVYALGAVLYDLLTGGPPFRAATPLETMAQVVNKEPVAPRLLNAGVPRDLETICLKCLEKEPSRRYTSAQALAEEGRHYFSMKLIEGGSLAERKKTLRVQGRNSAERVALLPAVIARAVHHAHQRGILHRDLKPANILLDAKGEPHVTDFGLAKRIDTDNALTISGTIVGTPSYIAPEQAGGAKMLTTALDVYSLGAILYELLTGHPPFSGANVLDTLMQVCERPRVAAWVESQGRWRFGNHLPQVSGKKTRAPLWFGRSVGGGRPINYRGRHRQRN